MGTVYLLHLSRPMSHARHYIGYSENLQGRLFHHRNGTGARFTQVAHERGIKMKLARTWEGVTRSWERQLKNYKKPSRFCPVCSGKTALKNMPGPAQVQEAKEDGHGEAGGGYDPSPDTA